MANKSASINHLPKHVTLTKSGIYRYRRRVPDTLKATIGKREIKRSLGSDYATMLQKCARLSPTIDKLFAAKPKAATNLTATVLSKLRDEHGIGIEDLGTIAEGYDEEEGEDIFLALDAALDEIKEELDVPPHIHREITAGRVPITLETIMDDYCQFLLTGDAAKDRQIKQKIERHKRRLCHSLGQQKFANRHISKLVRADARKVIEHLLTEVSPTSARRIRNDLNAAMNRAIRENDLNMRNPFSALEIKGSNASLKDRLPLDAEDMKALKPFMETDDDLGLIWGILRDTGARLKEALGLRVMDIDTANCAIKFEAHELRELKTANSERIVPIPTPLLVLLDAKIDGMEQADLLFPQYLGERKPDSCSQTLMKRFRKAVSHKRKVVYSLRHRMKDLLRNSDCPESLSREIMGHSDQSSASNYGSVTALEKKRDAMQKAWEIG